MESCCVCMITTNIPQLLSSTILSLSLSQAMCQNLGDLNLAGPLKDMNFSIPEGAGVRPIYQVISISWYPLHSN